MSDMPKTVEIHEEGPREGFQIEPGPIGSADKVRLIEALAQTGLRDIQVCSFVNPMIVEGQVHGALVQGIGQALYENTVYDASGQLQTGSFMDYCMPRADLTPDINSALEEVPCKTNPLGVKGIGESGTIGAPPTVINAIIDALKPLGVTDLDRPATSARVWEAMRQAKAAG